MIEVVGDLWAYPADVRIITTGGTVNSKGECIMSRGCAQEAKEQFPTLPRELGKRIKAEGNHPYLFELDGRVLITFPVKHQWFERADLTLIRTSALQLVRMIDPRKTYVVSRPGCDNGGREWTEIKPLLNCLPNCVHVITRTDAAADTVVSGGATTSSTSASPPLSDQPTAA
jgi:hypothetical protein